MGRAKRNPSQRLRRVGGLRLRVTLPTGWSGFKLFGKIDDETCRKTVLVLLLFAGLSLIAQALPSTFH
jgi:hypothetical protein